MLVEHVRDGRHRGERGPQFIRHIAGKLPRPVPEQPQFFDRLLQGRGHLVEPLDQFGQFVVSGRLEFTISGRLHLLEPGDSLHFRTYQPHSWRNPGDTLATAIWMALRM